jgi:hypothetical protein
MPGSIESVMVQRKWVHSHEEDTATTVVYRPSTYAFPPSRGRRSFEFQAGGCLVESAPGPTDRLVSGTGSWRVEGNELCLYSSDTSKQPRILHVLEATPERLVVGK